jgi:hypothetical protein
LSASNPQSLTGNLKSRLQCDHSMIFGTNQVDKVEAGA